ncbi:TPR-like protein [Hypoxylon trugodes]|uniref:TPR-like protein n=1 Tax=Hypoxylon trugodes TaxID=326681 RepID=UPI002197D441|nr:TPR-like protein [Hypoxylon trugodes]KAI1393504.1 TPR-like protein [Hypoxylon trugodes]
MAKLTSAFAETHHTRQKRFVVYGLAVFFVDASSRENASASYCEIAKTGGNEPNEKAAKNWLATRQAPWLLIIDNADDNEVPLDEILPTGNTGCVLITSRNPAHKSYDTVGEKYLELFQMDTEEANELILRTAEEPAPWAVSLMNIARDICKALGFFPLALVYAGKTISHKICSWSEYLDFYDHHVRRIQRGHQLQRNRSSSGDKPRAQKHDDYMNVFSTYEIIYRSLESSKTETFQDAVELLQLFSYFHHQNIRINILISAAINPIKEKHAQEEKVKSEEQIRKRMPNFARKKTWSTWLRELLIQVSRSLNSPPALPAALKNINSLNASKYENEVKDRLRLALHALTEKSLIMRKKGDKEQFSMHPVVHKWIRERPEMATSEQALWCQVASTVLARSILFPPLGDTETERGMRRELLPHIIHVRGCQGDIKERLEENRRTRKYSAWPAISTGFGRLEALESARFGQVYSECGLFQEALRLQNKVRDFAIRMLGEGHPISIKITLLLAGTLYELARASESTRLQRRIYDVCTESLGQYDPLTLKVTDMLASSLCFMGQFSASLSLHQKAVDGLTKIYGEQHIETLKAIHNASRVHLRYMDFEKSSELNHTAWEGMKKQLGETHPETLICLEDLAMSRIRLGERYLTECHDMMTFVCEQRKEALGKEQPYTLLAICNLGRVKSAMGQHREAADDMKKAVIVAERNLGENHFGVLAGKTHYAQVLVHLKCYKEAEEIFYTITRKPQYQKSTDDEGGEHLDRLIALWYLTGCLEKQGKF